MKRIIMPIVLVLAGIGLFIAPSVAQETEPEKVTPLPVLFVDPTCEMPEGHPVFPAEDDRYSYSQSDIVTNADDVVVESTWTAVVNSEFEGQVELVGKTSWHHVYPEPNCDDKPAEGHKKHEAHFPNTGA